MIHKIVVPEKPVEARTFNMAMVADMQEGTRDLFKKKSEWVFPQSVVWETYKEILSICEENNWRAILVTPPYTEYYSNAFPAEFYPVFHDAVNDFAKENGIPYFDYSHEEDFAATVEWYQDLSHLNAAGAAEFEKRLYADLQAAGLL